MKIKTSKKLDELLAYLGEKCGWIYVSNLLVTQTDYYTVPEKTTPDAAVVAGMKLLEKSQKSGKPIFEITYGDYSVYFVKDLSEVKKLLNSAIDKAEKELGRD